MVNGALRRKIAKMTKVIDIAVNLADEMYQGIYNGKKKHECDIKSVLERSWDNGVTKIMVTGTNLSESIKALELCQNEDRLFSTVGCHPTRCLEFEAENEPEQYFENLLELILKNRDKVAAIGECGLDYERTKFCPVDVQKKYFEKQILLSETTGLPMFLHCRNAASDLVSILSSRRDNIPGGVVHSFDGTIDDLNLILDLDLYVGVNGCSLKTAENLETASKIPLNRLLLETDAPWCSVRPSHAGYAHVKTHFTAVKNDKWQKDSMIKGRNEPSHILQVLEILAAIKNEDANVIAEKCYQNTVEVFTLLK